jgi:hypothetical protein
MVSALGAKVMLEAPAALIRFINTLGVDRLVESGRPLPPFDCYCPLLNLPLAFRTELDSIPATTPYLFADPKAVSRWHGSRSMRVSA